MAYAHGGPRLYYERSGAGEPLLWITGFTISAAVFDPILSLYTGELECLTYDNRGSGRSAQPLRPTSMPELAADAVRVLDVAGVASAHVYGLSMGGMIAQEMAIRFPERVRGLVLGGTTAGGPRAIRPTLRELGSMGLGAAGALRKPGRPWLGPLVFSDAFRREHPERARELLRHFARHRARPQGIAAHWWASVYHDTVSRLGAIRAPTLVLHGDADTMTSPDNARMLADAIPDAELVLLPGAGHAYLLEQPEASRDALTGWLARRGPIAPGVARTGWGARAEPLTRALGLPVGALRTGRSLLSMSSRARSRHVAPDRRAA